MKEHSCSILTGEGKGMGCGGGTTIQRIYQVCSDVGWWQLRLEKSGTPDYGEPRVSWGGYQNIQV